MNNQDYIKRAVELATGFDQFCGRYRTDSLNADTDDDDPEQWFLDALAAQLCRQVDATDDYYVEQTWDRTYVMYINSQCIRKVKERVRGDDRTTNTIRAIVDSKVLEENNDDLDEAQVFFEWLMVSDPWPLDYGHDLMTDFADELARVHGFDDWIDGYHSLTGKLQNHAFSGSTGDQ